MPVDWRVSSRRPQIKDAASTFDRALATSRLKLLHHPFLHFACTCHLPSAIATIKPACRDKPLDPDWKARPSVTAC